MGSRYCRCLSWEARWGGVEGPGQKGKEKKVEEEGQLWSLWRKPKGESGRVNSGFMRTPEDRSQRPIPLGPGTGRGGASLCQLQVPVPYWNTQTPPLWKSGSALSPHPLNTAGGLVAHSVLTGLFPIMWRGISLFSLIPNLSLPPCPPTPTSFPEPSFGRGDCLL